MNKLRRSFRWRRKFKDEDGVKIEKKIEKREQEAAEFRKVMAMLPEKEEEITQNTKILHLNSLALIILCAWNGGSRLVLDT